MVSVTAFSVAASPNLYVSEVTIPIDTICAPNKPQYTINYETGTPYSVGTNTFVPVSISGTVTYKPKGCCGTKTKIFTESITLGINAASPSSVTLTTISATSEVTDITCCMAKGFKITSQLALAFVTA